MDMPGISPHEFDANAESTQGPGPLLINDRGRSVMNRIRIGRPGARSERPWPGALSPDTPDPDIVRATGARAGRAFRKVSRDMMAWAGQRLWLVVRPVIRAVGMAHHEQVRMWECILETSGAAPLTAAGPLRWVRSLDGYRLEGSQVPPQDPSGTGR